MESSGTAPMMLVINPGSTSTKVAIFRGREPVYSDNIRHPSEQLSRFTQVSDQMEYRRSAVMQSVERSGTALGAIDAIVSRGGALQPTVGGVYVIDDAVAYDIMNCPGTEHAANLGPLIALAIAEEYGIPAYLSDPISVDEFEPLARLSGIPEIERVSLLHALSIRAVARAAAKALGRGIDQVNLIVAHLGGGISVCPVKRGRMIDANGASDEGPFSPERSGTLPMSDLVRICFSGEYTEAELLGKLTRKSGLTAHLGTSDAREIEKMIAAGDVHAREVVSAMTYQIAKEIGAMATVLSGEVDAIVLTGGLAAWERAVDDIVARCKFIAPVLVFPGENEMEALALGCLRVLTGEEEPKSYSRERARYKEQFGGRKE